MIRIIVKKHVSRGTRKALSPLSVTKAIRMSMKEIGTKLVLTSRRGIRNAPRKDDWYFYPGFGKAYASIDRHEYPAKQTGRLGRSIKTTRNGNLFYFGSDSRQAVNTRSGKNYAKFLQPENSTPRTKPRRGNRLFLTLAHREVAPQFTNIMEDNFIKMIKS